MNIWNVRQRKPFGIASEEYPSCVFVPWQTPPGMAALI